MALLSCVSPRPPGDEQHGCGLFAVHDLLDQFGQVFGRHGHHEEIHRLVKGGQLPDGRRRRRFPAADGWTTVILSAGNPCARTFCRMTRPKFRRDVDTPIRPMRTGCSRVWIFSTGLGAASVFCGSEKPAHSVKRHHHEVRKGEGVDLQFLDDEGGVPGRGRKEVSDLDERREAFDELFVGDHALLPARLSGQYLVGHGASEEFKKRTRPSLSSVEAETMLRFLRKLSARSSVSVPPTPAVRTMPNSRRGAQADDEFVAERGGVRRNELHQEHALNVLGDGRDQRVAGQPLVVRRGNGRGVARCGRRSSPRLRTSCAARSNGSCPDAWG